MIYTPPHRTDLNRNGPQVSTHPEAWFVVVPFLNHEAWFVIAPFLNPEALFDLVPFHPKAWFVIVLFCQFSRRQCLLF